MSSAPRKLPIGVQDFEKKRQVGYVYVDKTEYLYRLVQSGVPAPKLFSIPLVLLWLCLLLLFTGCGRQQGNIALTITSPDPVNGPLTPGHSFFISGSIQSDQPLPEDSRVQVTILDQNGTTVRTVQSIRKDWDQIDRFHPALFYYADNDPQRTDLHADAMPYLIVRDESDASASIRDATIKCYHNDTLFNAFIPYATDEYHGLLIDDGVGYVDDAGTPYTGLPEGQYHIRAVLTDKRGRTLAQDEGDFTIAPVSQALLCRFHPDEHYKRMLAFAAKDHLSMNVEYVPGYYRDRNGDDHGGMRAMFIGGDIAFYNESHVHMVVYLMSPTSTSMTVELPYIQTLGVVDDPERFTAYTYDIGEPELTVAGQTYAGHLIPMEGTDKLRLCRADLVEAGTEGRLDLSEETILETDTDLSDGISFTQEQTGDIMLAGVIAPHQLPQDRVLFDPGTNQTGLLDRVENIVYEVDDGIETRQYVKPVTLARHFSDGSEQDSLLEFYHRFTAEEIPADRRVSVSLYGIDTQGDPVPGTEETLVIHPEVPEALPTISTVFQVDNIDRFGNVVLDISLDDFHAAGFSEGDILEVQIGEQRIELPFVTDYTDVSLGKPLLATKGGVLGLWVSMGSFAEIYHVAERLPQDNRHWQMPEGASGHGDVTISVKEKAGYLEDYELRRAIADLHPATDRSDFPDLTDEQFANFRVVETTGMRKGTLYRSSSPIDNSYGRAAYADAAIRAHGIDYIINLSDSREEAEAMGGYADTFASTLETAYIDTGLDYSSEFFADKMAQIITFIAEHEGQYCVHCVVGRDRTGAVCACLSALMGASYEELADDYMETNANFFGIQKGTKQYDLLVEDNIDAMLRNLFQTEDPAAADLQPLAMDYLRRAGVSEDTLQQAMAHLGDQ